jgi:hypothetical protein
MRITILLLILAIVTAFPKYKRYKENALRLYECSSMAGAMLRTNIESYGYLASAIIGRTQPMSVYTNDLTGHWKILVHDPITGWTCTLMQGTLWQYALPRVENTW